jgi:hypothetical protein
MSHHQSTSGNGGGLMYPPRLNVPHDFTPIQDRQLLATLTQWVSARATASTGAGTPAASMCRLVAFQLVDGAAAAFDGAAATPIPAGTPVHALLQSACDRSETHAIVLDRQIPAAWKALAIDAFTFVSEQCSGGERVS